MRLFLLTILLLRAFGAFGQPDSAYTPGLTHNSKSKILIARLKNQYHSELKRNGLTNEMVLTKKYQEGLDEMLRKVSDSSFLNNKTIQTLLDDTFKRLSASNPHLILTPKTLLAYLNPLPNAYCVGEGTFLFTTGLLSRLQNQSQLAAVIAHELAHYELNHIYRGMLMSEASKKKAEQLSTGDASGDRTVDHLRGLQKHTAYVFEVYRKWEFEADSLGFLIFSNAGFRQSEYITSYSILDPEFTPLENPPSRFFAPLQFTRYPFKEEWLKPRAAIYGKSPWEFFLREDLMRTHPEIISRVERLIPKVEKKGQVNFVDEARIAQVRHESLLESAYKAANMRQLDIALHEVILGLNQLPHNTVMVTSMGRLLLRSAQVIQDNMLIYHQPTRTLGYDAHMLLVNNFLNNITPGELTELGYHFMNQKENFSSDLEEHYYLLWEFCGRTGRLQTQKSVAAEYEARFDKGQYRKLMR